jgi:hypothetical protein
VALPAGPHTIVMEYFEAGGGAVAKLHYSQTADPAPPLPGTGPPVTAEYFTNPTLSGAPALTRTEGEIDNEWFGGSPDPVIPVDNFSARWTQTPDLAAGSYVFSVTTDDGVRLFVDGHLLIDKWIWQGPTTYTTAVALPAGPHTIVMEYFEAGGGAVAKLHYSETTDPAPPLPGTAPPITAEYFTNPTLSGAPALTRAEAKIDNDWFAGSPDPVIPVDSFSARWTQTATYAAGSYHLTATGDDGIRVLVDAQLVIDGWSDHSATTYTADLALSEGEHTVVVEYYERGGDAIAKFSVTAA